MKKVTYASLYRLVVLLSIIGGWVACSGSPTPSDGATDSIITSNDSHIDAKASGDARPCQKLCAARCPGKDDGCGGICPAGSCSSGCCTATNQCFSGTTNSSCGKDGASCVDCAATGKTCEELTRTCVTDCDPKVKCSKKCVGERSGCGDYLCKASDIPVGDGCPGCCLKGTGTTVITCVAGTARTACGTGGANCTKCCDLSDPASKCGCDATTHKCWYK